MVNQQLWDFLDFCYNEVFLEVDVFDAISKEITLKHGEPPKGGFMDTYCKWYKEEVENDDE